MIFERKSIAGKVALAQLLAGRARPHKRFTLPLTRDAGRGDVEFAVRALSVEEQQQAQTEAMRHLTTTCGWQREDLVSDVGEGALNLELMTQFLARALVDPENPDAPMAADAGAVMGAGAPEEWRKAASRVRQLLDADEVQACFNHYIAFQEERSPFDQAKTVAEVKEMVDALGKGQLAPTRLMRCDHTTLTRIIDELVARGRTSTTPNSSDASPVTSSLEASSATSASSTEAPILFGSET